MVLILWLARLIAYISVLRQAIAENAPLCSLPLKSSSSRALHYSFFFFNFKKLFICPCQKIRGLLVRWPGIELTPLALEARNLNHWTTRTSHHYFFYQTRVLGFHPERPKDYLAIDSLSYETSLFQSKRTNDYISDKRLWVALQVSRKAKSFLCTVTLSFSAWFRNLCLSLRPPDAKSRLTEKDPDAGKDWGQKEKGAAEDEMVSITDSADKSLSKLRESVEDRGAWCAAIHGSQRVRDNLATEQQHGALRLNLIKLWPVGYFTIL